MDLRFGRQLQRDALLRVRVRGAGRWRRPGVAAGRVGQGERDSACSYFLSSEVQKTAEFWLLTFWLLAFSLYLPLNIANIASRSV